MTDVYSPYKLNRLNSSIRSQCEPPNRGTQRWSTFRSLEMHSKRHYKICISSVVLGQLESRFRNYKGFRIIFPKILDAILSFTKVRIFLIPLLIAFSESENVRFPFSTKNRLTWVLKCEKLNFRKS